MIDMALGTLPWKGVSAHVDVAVMKTNFDVREAVQEISPRLIEIWQHIAGLAFDSDPDYEMMFRILEEICAENGIRNEDQYDWGTLVEQYRGTLAAEFGVALRIDGGTDVLPYYSELGVPAVIRSQLEPRAGRTLRSPLVRTKNYSVMQASELNEIDEKGCCC
jgi:hypothetical protein